MFHDYKLLSLLTRHVNRFNVLTKELIDINVQKKEKHDTIENQFK